LQVQQAQQQGTLQQQQIQQQQIQMDQQRAINAAYQQSFKVDPDSGKPTFDQDAMTKALAL
jgi:hypothetical protein